ncbi:MAG: lipopolysaccharide biosynthesis protein [Thermodesulfobacteriota bacterium]
MGKNSEKKPTGDGSFGVNVALMAGGTTFSSALVFLAEPVTSRMFPPEAFGAASTFYAGATILGTVACLRYEMALLLPKEEEDAGNIFFLCIFILTAITVLAGISVYGIGRHVLALLRMEALWPASLWLFPAAVFLTGLDLLLRRWHTRQKRFNSIALSRAMQSIPRVLAEVCGGAAGFISATNFTSFRVFGLIGSPLNLSYAFLKHDLTRVYQHFTKAGLLAAAIRYIKFPLYESASALVMLLSLYSPIILLSSFFGPDKAGLFSKAFYLLYMPILIVGDSTSQAFFQLSSHRKAMGKELGAVVESVLTRMISIGVLPFSLIALAGPKIFSFVLGSWWSEAGIYAQIICPWLFVVLLNNSISTLFGTLERQGAGLLFNLVLIAFRLGVLFLGGLLIKDALVTAMLFTATSVLIILLMSSYLIRQVGSSYRRLWRHFFQSLLMAFPTLVMTALVDRVFKAPPGYVFVTAVLSSLPYLMMVFRSDPELRNLSLNLLEKLGVHGKRNSDKN